MRKTPTPSSRRSGLASRLLASTTVAAALLAGCGGGTSQVDSFKPERLLVFGDELSVLTNEGLKYSVNYVNDVGQFECAKNPSWVQTLAGHYGMVFSECNPDFLASPEGRMLAVAGATTDGLNAQIQGFTAGDSIRHDDLATVLIGMNDVLEAYAAFPAESEDVLVRRVQAAGARAAERVNELAAAGARVLVSTAPDMGITPFAQAEDDEHGNIRSRLLTTLSEAFNRELRLNLVNDGSKIGLLLLDDLLRSMTRVPGAYQLSNVDDAVCSTNVTMPNCSTQTLIEDDIESSRYLWADALRPGVNLHDRLGSQAIQRATNNPF
jgi:phospholipase/lecithinase/hemolysin